MNAKHHDHALAGLLDCAVCIGCGCDDFHACCDANGNPCHWLKVDYRSGVGVCSACSKHVPTWDRATRPAIQPTHDRPNTGPSDNGRKP